MYPKDAITIVGDSTGGQLLSGTNTILNAQLTQDLNDSGANGYSAYLACDSYAHDLGNHVFDFKDSNGNTVGQFSNTFSGKFVCENDLNLGTSGSQLVHYSITYLPYSSDTQYSVGMVNQTGDIVFGLSILIGIASMYLVAVLFNSLWRRKGKHSYA